MSFTITITLTFATRNEESDHVESFDKRADHHHAPKFDHIIKETLDGNFDDDIVSRETKKKKLHLAYHQKTRQKVL